VTQEFESLAGKIGRLARHAGHVAAWSRQRRDQTAADRVHRHREHNWNDRCCLLYREDRASRSDDHVDLATHELGRDLLVALVASLGPTINDGDGPTLDPAKLAKPPLKGCNQATPGSRRTGSQKPHHRYPRLQRARRQRTCRRRPAEQRDELAPRDHSITSSARASSVSGTVRPSALAVLVLTASSNLVGCCTGRSPG